MTDGIRDPSSSEDRELIGDNVNVYQIGYES